MPSPIAPAQRGRAFGPAGLGLVLPTFPQAGALPTAAELGALCRDAEDSGAAGLWACDHLYWHGPSLECLTALTVAAQSTQRCLVGSCVLQLPLRRPTVVAKAAASLQQLTSGRFVLGVGIGTHPGEYEAAGADYHRRGILLDAGLAELRTAWSEGGGPYVQLPAPTPVPIWVGGSSDAALRRAAAHDGWVPLFVAPDAYLDGLRRVRARAERAGRDPSALSAAVVAFVSVGDDPAEATERGVRFMSSLYRLPARAFTRHLVAGRAGAVARDLARWVERGARQVVAFVTHDRPLAQFTELAGEFAAVCASTPVPPSAGRTTAGVR